jgi:Flp pilus assembly pilin Flp
LHTSEDVFASTDTSLTCSDAQCFECSPLSVEIYFAEATITSANEDAWIAAVESVLFGNRRARRNLESADVAQIVTGSDTVTIIVRNPIDVKIIEDKVSSDSGFCLTVNAVSYCGVIVGAVESTATEPGKSSGATTVPLAVIVGVVAVAILVVGAILVFGTKQQSSDAATPLSEQSSFDWDDNNLLSGTPPPQCTSDFSNSPRAGAPTTAPAPKVAPKKSPYPYRSSTGPMPEISPMGWDCADLFPSSASAGAIADWGASVT